MTRFVLLAALLIAVAAVIVPGQESARANGLPQVIRLEYMPGVSNFGPDDAEGVLEFSFAERYAEAEVKNLVPEPGHTYEGWMLNEQGDTYELGDFELRQDGIGSLESSFPGLDSYDYDRFVVAARTAETPEGEMPAKVSIGGDFSVVGEGTPTPPPGDTRPEELPRTGEPAGGLTIDPVAGSLLAMGATGLAIVLVSNVRKRRRSTHD